MKQYPFPDNRIWKGAFGVFMIALLFLARDSMFTTAVIGFNKAQFLMLGLICAAGIVFLAVNHRNLKAVLTDRRMLVIAVFSALMLLPASIAFTELYVFRLKNSAEYAAKLSKSEFSCPVRSAHPATSSGFVP